MKLSRTFGIVFLTLLPILALAEIEVALIKVFNLKLEHAVHQEDGYYFHSAIRYHNGWIHAHPERGVEFIRNLADIEFPFHEVHFYKNEQMPSLIYDDIAPYMGLPFDKEYTWADAKIYCSELIAKILNFAPLPFTKDESEGERRVGISPDDLREILKNQGFERVTTGEACYFNARSFLSQSD